MDYMYSAFLELFLLQILQSKGLYCYVTHIKITLFSSHLACGNRWCQRELHDFRIYLIIIWESKMWFIIFHIGFPLLCGRIFFTSTEMYYFKGTWVTFMYTNLYSSILPVHVLRNRYTKYILFLEKISGTVHSKLPGCEYLDSYYVGI